MNSLEIALIILGIIVIVISCILVDKNQKQAEVRIGGTLSPETILSEEVKKQLRGNIEDLFSEIKDEVIVTADDTLSKMSNEKIIAVNEFSDQILEKIKQNHEEVIFLYNMLNDKEKELKSAVKEIDASKKIVQDILDSKMKNNSTVIKENKMQAVKPATQADQIAKSITSSNNHQGIMSHASKLDDMEINKNKILNLYSQGKSIVEISKLLELGQGEVKLVIDLFKAKK